MFSQCSNALEINPMCGNKVVSSNQNNLREERKENPPPLPGRRGGEGVDGGFC